MSRDLQALPLNERLAELTCSIIEHDNDAVIAVVNLMKLIDVMAYRLSAANRFCLAERCRDLADQLEKREVMRTD